MATFETIIHRQQSSTPPFFEDITIQSIPVNDNKDELVNINTANSSLVKMLPAAALYPEDMEHSVGLPHSSFIRSGLFQRLEGAVQNLRIFTNRSKLVFMVVEGLRKRSESRDSDENLHKATGGCVSFRVFDEEIDEYVDMGDSEVLTFSKNLTPVQKQNRIHLLSACGIAGLVNYPYEWWTFCFGTRYFAYYTENKVAVYDNVL